MTNEKIENIKPWELDKPMFNISYPWFAYTRFFDIIICNLADTLYPQKVIKLPKNLKIQSMAECNFTDRIVIASWDLNTHAYVFHEIVMPRPFQQLL